MTTPAKPPVLPLIDERVKWMSFTGFKAKMRRLKRQEIESFKHFNEIWQIEEEAVVVPFEMWMQIQQTLADLETRQ